MSKVFYVFFELGYCLIDSWVRASRTLPHANQDTNGSIEAYHGFLKKRFLGSFKRLNGRRIDWLIHILTSKVTPYYWYNHKMKNLGFIKNTNVMELIESAYEKAKLIPDENVLENSEGNYILVRSMTSHEVLYRVYGANTNGYVELV